LVFGLIFVGGGVLLGGGFEALEPLVVVECVRDGLRHLAVLIDQRQILGVLVEDLVEGAFDLRALLLDGFFLLGLLQVDLHRARKQVPLALLGRSLLRKHVSIVILGVLVFGSFLQQLLEPLRVVEDTLLLLG